MWPNSLGSIHDPYNQNCPCSYCSGARQPEAQRVTVCHFSDWHGCWYKLPKADLYICTGDMLYNYPNIQGITVHNREIYCQGKAVQGLGNQRERLGISKEAPVVVVRGNHDFVSLAKLFGDENTYEIGLSATIFHNLCGLKVGGFRGTNFIGGEWSDEFHDADFSTLGHTLPLDLDILVTHAPPYGVLDTRNTYEGRSPHWGIQVAANHVNRQSHAGASLKLHCFGHVHTSRGTMTRGELPRQVYFSNAAGGYNLFEWNKTKITPKVIKKLEGKGNGL